MGEQMSSEEPPPPSEENAPSPAPAPAVSVEKPLEPGEEWIEEYESEKTETKPKKKIPHLRGLIIAIAIVVILVVWTVISPQVLPESGATYVDSETYANLGSYEGDLDIWWLFNVVHVADTTWGVSVSGEQNVSSGQPATFHVLVTKVDEEMKNSWFVGTSVKLKAVDLYTEDGTKVGSMVSKSCESFGPTAEVDATFDSPGTYSCYVYVEMTIYGKMTVGYLPVKVLRITADLDVSIIAS